MQAGVPVINCQSSQNDSQQVPPVQRYRVQHVIFQNTPGKYILQNRRRRLQTTQHQKGKQYRPHIPIPQRLLRDIRMSQRVHPVNIQQQRHDRHHDPRTDIRRIQPIIKLTIFKNESQRQKKDRPQNTAQPIYPVQRQRLHKPEMAGKQNRAQPNDKQQPDNQPMHISPVSPIA